VLRIHLKLRDRDIKNFPAADVQEVVAVSEGYVPAEIESAVKDALVDAFSSDEEMEMSHVLKALKSMVPLSKAFAAKIQEMNEWARANATPAGREGVAAASAAVANSRRVSTRKRS
jgi:SpoVK/Ycf46/Vps4 family AAA+-type ATPase